MRPRRALAGAAWEMLSSQTGEGTAAKSSAFRISKSPGLQTPALQDSYPSAASAASQRSTLRTPRSASQGRGAFGRPRGVRSCPKGGPLSKPTHRVVARTRQSGRFRPKLRSSASRLLRGEGVTGFGTSGDWEQATHDRRYVSAARIVPLKLWNRSIRLIMRSPANQVNDASYLI